MAVVDGIQVGGDAANQGDDNDTAATTQSPAGPVTTLLSRLFAARIDREHYD